MIVSARMTKGQKKRAYKNAVQAVLIQMYSVPESASKKIVSTWWKSLSETSAFKTGLFMHAEPVNTAADLIRSEVIPISAEKQETYHRILRESRASVLHGKQKPVIIEIDQAVSSPLPTRQRLLADTAKAKKKAQETYLLAGR